jgi:hypothetical protein
MFSELLFKEYTLENEKPLIEYSKGSKKKAFWQCSDCSYKWQTRISHRTNGSGCPKCGHIKTHFKRAVKRPSIMETDSDVAKEWNDNTDINLVSRGSNKKYCWKCNVCFKIYYSTPNSRCCQKTGCPYCSGRLVTDRNRLSFIRPDLAKELVNIDASTLCCNSRLKQLWKCEFCEHQWESTVNNRFRGRDCPKCALKNSKPQRKIEEFLNKNKICYKTEYKITECKNKRPLPFDFAIFKPKDDLIFLIEYQGEQHFFPIWGQKQLQYIQNNDKIKLNFCKTNNINLFEINFLDDLEQKMQLFLRTI